MAIRRGGDLYNRHIREIAPNFALVPAILLQTALVEEFQKRELPEVTLEDVVAVVKAIAELPEQGHLIRTAMANQEYLNKRVFVASGWLSAATA